MITAKEQQIVIDGAKAAMRKEFEERFQELQQRLDALEKPKTTRAKAA